MKTRYNANNKGRHTPYRKARGDGVKTAGAQQDSTEPTPVSTDRFPNKERSQTGDRFRATLDNLLDPFVLMEAVRDSHQNITDFRFTYANDAARQNLARKEGNLIGRTLREVLPAHFQNGLFAQYRQVAETGNPLVLDCFEYEDGPDNTGECPCLVLDIRATRVGNGLALTWRDVTQQRRMQADLSEVQRRLVDSIETERKKLAHVLHDGPVQDLYAIDYQLHGLQLRDFPPADQEALNVVQGMLHQVIGTLLATVGELRPMTLAPFGLHAAILSHMHDFAEKDPAVQLTLHLDEDHQSLPDPLRLGFFRIFQQIISNIQHHARASHVEVTLKIESSAALLRVVDNGVGFQTPERLVTLARAGQLGLASAFEQAQRLGGRMDIVSQPGNGTAITVVCPLSTSLPAAP